MTWKILAIILFDTRTEWYTLLYLLFRYFECHYNNVVHFVHLVLQFYIVLIQESLSR